MYYIYMYYIYVLYIYTYINIFAAWIWAVSLGLSHLMTSSPQLWLDGQAPMSPTSPGDKQVDFFSLHSQVNQCDHLVQMFSHPSAATAHKHQLFYLDLCCVCFNVKGRTWRFQHGQNEPELLLIRAEFRSPERRQQKWYSHTHTKQNLLILTKCYSCVH